jgi:hypothetical protein
MSRVLQPTGGGNCCLQPVITVISMISCPGCAGPAAIDDVHGESASERRGADSIDARA